MFFFFLKPHWFSNPDSFGAQSWLLWGGSEAEREEGESTVRATVLPLREDSKNEVYGQVSHLQCESNPYRDLSGPKLIHDCLNIAMTLKSKIWDGNNDMMIRHGTSSGHCTGKKTLVWNDTQIFKYWPRPKWRPGFSPPKCHRRNT